MSSVKDLSRFGLNLDTARKIPPDEYHQLVRQGCQPLPGDVLIAKDGATALDTVCEIRKPVETVLLSSVAILRNRSLSGVLFPPAPTRNNASHVHEGGTRSDQGDSDQQQVAAA
jgi:hypothetical protein